MDRPNLDSVVRRYKAYVSPYGTSQLHLKNPLLLPFGPLPFLVSAIF